MSLQETVIDSTTAWYMTCDICGERSESCPTTAEALQSLKEKGWVSKSYYQNILSRQDWYCPKCAVKATEERDTIPDVEVPV